MCFFLSRHALHDDEQQLAAHVVKRASSSSSRQPTYCDRLPLSAAEGPLGTVLLKICVRTWHFTSHVRRGPRPQPMPAVYIFFGRLSNPFYEEDVDSALCAGFFSNNFVGKIIEISGKLRARTFVENP